MDKIVFIFAPSHMSYMMFLGQFKLDPKKHKLVRSTEDFRAHPIGAPGVLLEGYERNPNYTPAIMEAAGSRLNMGFIPEEEYLGIGGHNND